MPARIFDSVTDPDLAAMIARGAIGVIPTDTVYGLVGHAEDEAAISRLYQLKQRALQPGTLIAARAVDFEKIGFSPDDLSRADKFWPNAISVVLNATNVASFLKQSRTDLALRIPDSSPLAQLLEKTGALMTTSANAPTEPTATTLQQARDYFGDQVDFYVDAGDLGDRPPSTIIGIDEDSNVIIYRQGAAEISR